MIAVGFLVVVLLVLVLGLWGFAIERGEKRRAKKRRKALDEIGERA